MQARVDTQTTAPALGHGRYLVRLPWRERDVDIEYQWIDAIDSDAPVMIFLHEGLGSIDMWKDFPAQVCKATGMRGLVYSRPAYGWSTPRGKDEQWLPDFMHQQAHEVLPELRKALGLQAPVWLLGHSDGGSIALLHAAQFPSSVTGSIVLAPHVMVEDISIASITEAAKAYQTTNLREKLARYHADVDSAFGGWAGIWLNPVFRAWNILGELRDMGTPTLAIQGLDDEYGTLEQIRSIARLGPHVSLLELPQCGHSPHRDQAAQAIIGIQDFVQTRRQK